MLYARAMSLHVSPISLSACGLAHVASSVVPIVALTTLTHCKLGGISNVSSRVGKSVGLGRSVSSVVISLRGSVSMVIVRG